MIRLFYRLFKKRIWDMVAEDFYGTIPEEIRQPSITFLGKARGKLEPFFSLQAYNIQKRSIQDPKNTALYQGMLIQLRVLLQIITREPLDIERGKESKKEVKDDYAARISEFIHGSKQINGNKTTEN